MSISKLRALIWPAAIFGLVWLGSLPLAEFSFRGLGDRPSSDLIGLYAPFRDGAYRLAASANTGASWAAGKFSVHTDTLGLRCDEKRHFATAPGQNIDCLFLGDSQGYGHGVDFENTIPGAVAVMADAEQWKVRTIAVGGHSLRNQFDLARWLREEQSVRTSNYVVLLTPVMLSNGSGFVRAAVGADGRIYEKPPGRLAQVLIWLKSHTVVYSRIRDAVRNSGIGVTPAADPFVFQLFLPHPDQQTEENLFKALSEVKAFADTNGARLHLVYVPLTVEIQSKSLVSAAKSRGIDLDLDLPVRILSSVAKRLDVQLYDLRPVVAEFAQDQRPLQLKGDFHYNAGLSRACATSVWQHLKVAMPARAGTSHQFTKQ